jgi:hypothetical protein
MSDTALNSIIQYGTSAERGAFTPSPAVGSQVLYIWYDTDSAPDTYVWDGSAWVQINVAGSVTFAASDRLLGRDTAGAGASEEIPVSSGLEFTGGPGLRVTAAVRTETIGITVDGGGSVLTTGVKGYRSFPVAGTITGWRLLADVAGDIEFDILKDAFGSYPSTTSIVAAAPPELAGVDSDEDTTLTGWTTSVSAGDVFGFEIVGSPATIERVTLELTIVVTG